MGFSNPGAEGDKVPETQDTLELDLASLKEYFALRVFSSVPYPSCDDTEKRHLELYLLPKTIPL